eukprot:419026-Hanusia_phi.AAC.1
MGVSSPARAGGLQCRDGPGRGRTLCDSRPVTSRRDSVTPRNWDPVGPGRASVTPVLQVDSDLDFSSDSLNLSTVLTPLRGKRCRFGIIAGVI